MSFLKKIKTKYWIIIVISLSFISVFIIPIKNGEAKGIGSIFGVVGLLFGILVGFFITELWTRFERIRDNVAVEVSGLQTYYLYIQGLNNFPQHKDWVKKEQKLIDQYIREFFKVEWTDYDKIDPYFNDIMKSLADIGELKTNREIETFTNLLPILNEVTTAREKLFMYGKDKLDKIEWVILISLAIILIISIIVIRVPNLLSLVLSGILISTVITLLLLLRDLDNLTFGEEVISFESYETIFDVIGMPRFYLKRDIESGRVKIPKNKKYRIE